MERHILIVDDEANILSALDRLLDEGGFVVHRASSGEEGLQVIDSNPQIGVILSDQRMPGMTGTEFLKAVKETRESVVRMILSGYSELNAITQAINEGSIFKFVSKPWDDFLLLNTVKEAFEYFELAEHNRHLTEELQSSNHQLAELNRNLERLVDEKANKLKLHVASLKTYQEAMEYFPFGVLGIDPSGNIVLENKAARDMISKTKTSLIGFQLDQAVEGDWANLISQAERFNLDSEQNPIHFSLNNHNVSIFRLDREAKSFGQLIVLAAG
ncbi:MAG: response regulator [Ketobacter sp.]|nr:MAG: response regulator [Ketobacter sp.]